MSFIRLVKKALNGKELHQPVHNFEVYDEYKETQSSEDFNVMLLPITQDKDLLITHARNMGLTLTRKMSPKTMAMEMFEYRTNPAYIPMEKRPKPGSTGKGPGRPKKTPGTIIHDEDTEGPDT